MNAEAINHYTSKRGGSVVPEPNSGCWLWDGTADKHGYGYFSYGGRRVFAHRAAFASRFRVLDSHEHVCHRCDVPACVNPDHLFLGDQRANMADKKAKGRVRAPKGEKSGRAKLTEAQAQEILRLHAEGAVPQVHIARAFGISRRAMREITDGRNWKHLPRPPLSAGYVGKGGKIIPRTRSGANCA